MAAKDLVSIHHLSYDLTVEYLRRITDLGDAFELRDIPRPGVLDGLNAFAESFAPEEPSGQPSSAARRSLFNVPGRIAKKALVRSVYSESLSHMPMPVKSARPNSRQSAAPHTPILALTTEESPRPPLTISQASGCGSTALMYYYFCCCFQGTITPGGVFPSLVEDGDWLVTRSCVALIPRNENSRARVIAARHGGTTTIPHPMNYIRFVDLGAFENLEQLRLNWFVDHIWVACGSHEQAAELAQSDWPILNLADWTASEIRLAAFWCHPKLAKRDVKLLQSRLQSHGQNLKHLFAAKDEETPEIKTTMQQPPVTLRAFCQAHSDFMTFFLHHTSESGATMMPYPRSSFCLKPKWKSAEYKECGLEWLKRLNATEIDLWNCWDGRSDRVEKRPAITFKTTPRPQTIAAEKPAASVQTSIESVGNALMDRRTEIEPPQNQNISSKEAKTEQNEKHTNIECVVTSSISEPEYGLAVLTRPQPGSDTEEADNTEVSDTAPENMPNTFDASVTTALTSNCISTDQTAVSLAIVDNSSQSDLAGIPSPPPLNQSPLVGIMCRQPSALTPIAEERSDLSIEQGDQTPRFCSRARSDLGVASAPHHRVTTPGACQPSSRSVHRMIEETSVTALPRLQDDSQMKIGETQFEGLCLPTEDDVTALRDIPMEVQNGNCLVLSRPTSPRRPSQASSPRSLSCAVIIDSDYEIGQVIMPDHRGTPPRLSIGRQQPCEIMDESNRGQSNVRDMVKVWEMSMSPDASMAPSGARQSAMRARIEQKRRTAAAASVRSSVRRKIGDDEEFHSDAIEDIRQAEEDGYPHQICLAPNRLKKRRYSTDQPLMIYPQSAPLLASDTVPQDNSHMMSGLSDLGSGAEDVDTLERDIRLLKHQMNMAARQWRMCEAALGTMTSRLEERKMLNGGEPRK